jgi:hypothetical protein
MMNHYKLVVLSLWCLMLAASCKKGFLNVVPDNIPTVDNAFASGAEASTYLATCYSYLPHNGVLTANPAFLSGDETSVRIAKQKDYELFLGLTLGNQGVVDPYYNNWDGGHQGGTMFNAIRDCNVFLDNIGKVPDLSDDDKSRMSGEVQFLKGYYHFLLLRSYGPIPVVDKNIPISASLSETQIKRQPVDSVVNYISSLYDQAADKLKNYPSITNKTTELGRITSSIALSMKARLLVMAASPLFNGNPDYANFKDKDGKALFNPTVDPTKWQRAATAAKAAIDLCEGAGLKLYDNFQGSAFVNISPVTALQMNIRTAVTDETWSTELIWGFTNSGNDLQYHTAGRVDPSRNSNVATTLDLGPTYKEINRFYSSNGVPIDEDKTLDFTNPAALRIGVDSEKYNIIPGYATARINFDREPRYYADLGFDGGKWFTKNAPNNSDDPGWPYECKLGQAGYPSDGFSQSGYLAKKMANWNFVYTDNTFGFTTLSYPWPEIRLADLYLLYAEALNETADAPAQDVFTYIDKVRTRAGLPGVQQAWNTYSKFPTKYATRDGMRSIIQRERMIELAFEGQIYWDIKRWKQAAVEFNMASQGWDAQQSDASLYYRVKTYFTQVFVAPRDYLFPIKENDLLVNPNLVQNPGW